MDCQIEAFIIIQSKQKYEDLIRKHFKELITSSNKVLNAIE